METPLAGLRVLDFSRLFPGPYCTHLLSEMGAEVIKVEDVVEGDSIRSFPPFVGDHGALFAALNRYKQSVSFDLKHLECQEAAQALSEQCDVVVESFRPGVATRLGIDFETLAGRNPRLVYCSISGFGQSGEHQDLPGHDLTYAALTGLLDSLFPGTPAVPGVQLVDSAGALLATIRILAALRVVATGPQYLDVSLSAAAEMLMPANIAEAQASATTSPSLLDTLRGSPRYNLYECLDGVWLAVAPLEEQFWNRFNAVLADMGAVAPEQAPTSDALRAVFQSRPADEWFGILSRANVPAAPVRTVTEAVTSMQVPEGNAPRLGEHTARWLERVGYTPSTIDGLVARGAVRLG